MNKALIAALALAATLGAGTPALAADAHSHDAHAHATPQKLTLDNGRKWATDEPLRRGMGALHAAFAGKQHALHEGKVTPAEYRALGKAVEAKVGAIVAECKLPPEADANLHIVVAELVAAADALQGKSAERPDAGALKAVKALNQYGTHFDHPGWVALH